MLVSVSERAVFRDGQTQDKGQPLLKAETGLILKIQLLQDLLFAAMQPTERDIRSQKWQGVAHGMWTRWATNAVLTCSRATSTVHC